MRDSAKFSYCIEWSIIKPDTCHITFLRAALVMLPKRYLYIVVAIVWVAAIIITTSFFGEFSRPPYHQTIYYIMEVWIYKCYAQLNNNHPIIQAVKIWWFYLLSQLSFLMNAWTIAFKGHLIVYCGIQAIQLLLYWLPLLLERALLLAVFQVFIFCYISQWIIVDNNFCRCYNRCMLSISKFIIISSSFHYD